MAITLYNVAQYSAIKRAGLLAGELLDHLCKIAEPGMSTGHLDRVAEGWIKSHGAIPTFKGYKNGGPHKYPATICTSVNQQISHTVPNDNQTLNEGDILTLDIGVTVKEDFKGDTWKYIGDTARTIPIGQVNTESLQLLKFTSLALSQGIEQSIPGNKVEDISRAVYNTATEAKLNLVKEQGGHGIGPNYHSEPSISNSPYFVFGIKDQDLSLRPGMLICIEPIFTLGSGETTSTKYDGWTIETKDQTPAAHFEHTILITEDSPYITTKV